jgi:hypothetical protein
MDRMSWHRSHREEVDLDSFDPGSDDYSKRELEAYADAMLREDAKQNGSQGILFEEHLYSRRRREVYTAAGVPDEAITHALSKDGQTMYNRTHPQGRKVNSEQQRKKNGASFYR